MGYAEPPRSVDTLRDADPRPDDGRDGRWHAVVDERNGTRAAEVDAVVGERESERLAQLARAIGQSAPPRPRRRRISSMPATGVTARMSTAVPRPRGPVTMLAQVWMPYDR